MKSLDFLLESIGAEVAAKATVQALMTHAFDNIEDKIVMQMVPQHSIDRINDLAAHVISSYESRYQKSGLGCPQIMNEPKPGSFDRAMQRNVGYTKSVDILSQSLRDNRTCWMQSERKDSKTKLSIRKSNRIYGIKEECSKTSILLNFSPPTSITQKENALRRMKEDDQRRRWKDQNQSITQGNSKSLKTDKQISTLLGMKKDYTYDQNGGIIPINKNQKTTLPKMEVSFLMQQETREKAPNNQIPITRVRSKLKKTEIKLDQAQNYLYDNKSPFLRNFESLRKDQQHRQHWTPDKILDSEAPAYMRILTQDGGIKKRYARYKNDKGQIGLSLKERLKQNNTHRYSLSKIQNTGRSSIRRETSMGNEQLQISGFGGQSSVFTAISNKIRIVNELLRRNVIQANDSVHKNQQPPSLKNKNRLPQKSSFSNAKPLVDNPTRIRFS